MLFGFGRIGRLLTRLLVEKAGNGKKLMLRAIVVRPPKKEAGHLAKRQANLMMVRGGSLCFALSCMCLFPTTVCISCARIVMPFPKTQPGHCAWTVQWNCQDRRSWKRPHRQWYLHQDYLLQSESRGHRLRGEYLIDIRRFC